MPQRPNAILIMTDHQRADAMGFAGNSIAGHTIVSVEIAYLDADGDENPLLGALYDTDDSAKLFYYENSSTEAGPSFGGRQSSPFGIALPAETWSDYYGGPGIAAADLDGDGDIDLLVRPRSAYPAYGPLLRRLFLLRKRRDFLNIHGVMQVVNGD